MNNIEADHVKFHLSDSNASALIELLIILMLYMSLCQCACSIGITYTFTMGAVSSMHSNYSVGVSS